MCQYCEKSIASPAKTKASNNVPVKSSWILHTDKYGETQLFIRAEDKYNKVYYQACFTIQYCPLCGKRI